MGGALVAVSPDIQRGTLGVTGMNYSTLLNRSVDWEGEFNPPDSQEDIEELIEDLQDDPADAITGTVGAYSVPFYALYRDPIERQLIFALMQMLWDRGESNGYAQHMTDDPLSNTPPHDVMLQIAWSDHQVANVAAEVQARTLGAPIMVPGLPAGEHWEMDPYFADTATYPYDGSALVYWDSGNATPPNENIPPEHNGDPHGHPRNETAAGWQEAHFLLTGQMADVCDGKDYLTSRHPAVRADASLRCVPPPYPPGTSVDPELTGTATPDPTGTASVSPTEDPGPRATTVRFTENSASSGQFSDAVTLEVKVTDATSGEPIADRGVTFELAGADSSRTFTATTDSAGVARVTETLTERPGEYQLTARSAADEDRLAGADADVFVVDKEDTSLTLDVTGNGAKRVAVAVLTDADSGTGVAGRAIQFHADGEQIGAATTDGSGRAEQPVPPRYRGGRREFSAHFTGDDYYRSSTARDRT